MCKPGSVNGRRGDLQIQTREPIKSIRIASNFTKWPWLEIAKEVIVHIKNMQSSKIYIIQHIAWAFYIKYSSVTSFVISNIFINNCDSITYFFSVTVTDNNYIYFVIKLCRFKIHVKWPYVNDGYDGWKRSSVLCEVSLSIWRIWNCTKNCDSSTLQLYCLLWLVTANWLFPQFF